MASMEMEDFIMFYDEIDDSYYAITVVYVSFFMM